MKPDLDLQATLLYRIHEINNAINSSFDHAINLSQSRLELLLQIEAQVEMDQNDLRKKVTLDAAAITRHLIQLERTGMITRSRKETDRRMQIIRLTNLGRQMLKEAKQERARLIEHLFASISDDEYQKLEQVIDKLYLSVVMRSLSVDS